MRWLYRLVVVVLVAFMLSRSPLLLRLQQTASHLSRSSSISSSSFSTATRLKDDDMGDRPNGTIATKGLELLTFGTPNGHKASIVLEELKEAYGKPDYVYQSIHMYVIQWIRG